MSRPTTKRAAECADAIHKLMDGTEWRADTLDAIAEELREAGYVIRDVPGAGEEIRPLFADIPGAAEALSKSGAS